MNGLVYRYTAIKETNDPLVVSVQNQNALTGGYIFQETDNWSGLPGNTITKQISLPSVSYELWGPGEITVEGKGKVENPSIIYNYTYDNKCNDPLADPTCPGYVEALRKYVQETISFVDEPTYDEYLYHNKDSYSYDEQKKNSGDGEKSRSLNGKGENKLMTAEALEQQRLLEQLNDIPGFDLYYVALNGGVYDDVLRYEDKKIPENKNGLRNNFAQQVLHQKMVESQYKQR